MSGMLNFLLGLAVGEMQDSTEDNRKTAMNDKLANGTVDTCLAADTGKRETGICVESDHWLIVEKYADKKDAKRGHARWIKRVKSGVTKEELEELNDGNCADWAFGGTDD